MGKLDASMIRYLTKKDFRVLAAVERGMTDHEVVPDAVVAAISSLHHGGCHKTLGELAKHRLVAYEKGGRQVLGYRLTNAGHDYLALNVLSGKNVIEAIGRQIGVGKESDVYIVSNAEGEDLCLKLHRLGRTSFRQVKNKRDYHKNRSYVSWVHLSSLSASKEFLFLKALYDAGFSVPRPVDYNRHAVVMELVDATPMWQLRELANPGLVYSECMDFIERLASHGLIHGDFNEFNIMVKDDESIVVYDLPQALSISHINAEWYFNRDVECIRTFFQKRFGFDGENFPEFKDIVRTNSIDVEVEASGYKTNFDPTLQEAVADVVTPVVRDGTNEDSNLDKCNNEAVRDEESEEEEGCTERVNSARKRYTDNLDISSEYKDVDDDLEAEENDTADGEDSKIDHCSVNDVSRKMHKLNVSCTKRETTDSESEESKDSDSESESNCSHSKELPSDRLRLQVSRVLKKELKLKERKKKVRSAYQSMTNPKKLKEARQSRADDCKLHSTWDF